MANPWIEMVTEFHRKFGHPVAIKPSVLKARIELRRELIKEECEETRDALLFFDTQQTADGICDAIYVLIGTALECGIDLDPIFAEVHRSNMDKIGGTTREDGKTLKPEGWKPPRIRELLIEQGWEPWP